jgi:hypothetical protein
MNTLPELPKITNTNIVKYVVNPPEGEPIIKSKRKEYKPRPRLNSSAQGKLIETIDEIIEMAVNKKSIYHSGMGYRLPASVIVNWSVAMVHRLLHYKMLYHYIPKWLVDANNTQTGE